MTETLHWYAETSGGVQTGNCTVTENGGMAMPLCTRDAARCT